MLAILLVCWYVLGVAGFIYWWTSEFDFKSETVLIAIAGGIAGPAAWVIGWCIHSKGPAGKPRVLVKKRLVA